MNLTATTDFTNAAAVEFRERSLLSAAAFLNDIYATQLSPFTVDTSLAAGAQPLLLQAIQSALTSPDALSGMGLHLLVAPALENLDKLGALMGPATTSCAPQLRSWSQNLLRPIAAAIAKNFIATYSTESGFAMQTAMALAGVSSAAEATKGFFNVNDAESFLFNLTRSFVMWKTAMLEPKVRSFPLDGCRCVSVTGV